jgi:trans-L-3-hydroxyproline dehydratase
VLFLHNEGFSTMCGHGIIALTKVILETGVLPASDGETTIRIDTPAGQISSTAHVVEGSVTSVRFRNVPSFVDALDDRVAVAGIGDVVFDLAFGGAYYAYVDAVAAGLSWPPANQAELIDCGRRIKDSIVADRQIEHPREADLGFLYGVIFTGPPSSPGNDYRNVCVFADGEIDRSPTGTGVSGRIAIDAARRRIGIGESLRIESIVGSVFTGCLAEETIYHGKTAVIPEIEGTAFITGKATYFVDPSDPLSPGFLIR